MARDKTREELADEVENLRRRVAELEAGKSAQQVDLLRSILDSIGEGVIVIDKEGKSLVFNPMARRILGVEPTEDPPEKWPQFYNVFHPDKVTPFAADELPTVRAMHGEAIDDVESFRRTPNEPDGIFISTSARPLKDEDGQVQGVVVIFRDITRHKRLQEELQAHRNRLQQLVDERTTELQAANNRLRKEIIERERAEEAREESQHFAQGIADALPNMIYVYDSIERRNVYTNDRISRILGYPPGQARKIESNLHAFVHPDDYPAVRAYLERLAQGGDEEVHEVEYRMCHADGGWRWLHSRSVVFARTADGALKQHLGTSQDVTERRQAQEELRELNEILEERVRERTAMAEQRAMQLRRLALELSQTEDREHRRLATNLHDRIGQSLNVSLMKLGALRASASGTQFAGPLEEIHRLLDQAVDDTQSLVVELSPPVLYELGLEAALEWLAEQMQEQHGLRVEVRTQGSAGPLDPDMRGILFRMVRELLFNVVKHARAQTAEVHVCWEDEVMHIEVADDGIGFNTDGLSSSLGRSDKFGLFSIRERLDSIGGQLHINSQPGRGTQVALTAPQKRTAGKNGKRLQVPS